MDYAELEAEVTSALYKKDAVGLISPIMEAIDKHVSARLLAVAEDFKAMSNDYNEAAESPETNERMAGWYAGRSASYFNASVRMINEAKQ